MVGFEVHGNSIVGEKVARDIASDVMTAATNETLIRQHLGRAEFWKAADCGKRRYDGRGKVQWGRMAIKFCPGAPLC